MTGPAYDRLVVDAGGGVLRLLRAALTTLVVLGLASGAHTVGGGSAPTVPALAVLTIVLGPALWWASSRELTPLRMTAMLGGSQVLVHAALMAMAPVHGSAPAVHVHGNVLLPSLDQPMVMGHLTPSMLAVHAAATALTAVVLARAERILWWVVSTVLPRRRSLFRAVPAGRVAPVPVRPLLPFRGTRPLGGRAPPLLAA